MCWKGGGCFLKVASKKGAAVCRIIAFLLCGHLVIPLTIQLSTPVLLAKMSMWKEFKDIWKKRKQAKYDELRTYCIVLIIAEL